MPGEEVIPDAHRRCYCKQYTTIFFLKKFSDCLLPVQDVSGGSCYAGLGFNGLGFGLVMHT